MKPLKFFACGLVMVLVVGFAALPAAHAASGVEEYWPIDNTAKGDRSAGQLTIYYEVVDETGCTLEEFQGQPTVKMIFLLRLYEKKTKTWHIITSQYDGPPFCLTGDLYEIDGKPPLQQETLMTFLNTEVLLALNGSDTYTGVLLKDVTDAYENIFGSEPEPYCVSADIVIVAQ